MENTVKKYCTSQLVSVFSILSMSRYIDGVQLCFSVHSLIPSQLLDYVLSFLILL